MQLQRLDSDTADIQKAVGRKATIIVSLVALMATHIFVETVSGKFISLLCIIHIARDW